MSIRRIIAITVIFIIAWAGWFILGAVTTLRSDNSFTSLSYQVNDLWGRPLIQKEPSLSVRIPGSDGVRRLIPTQNEINVELLPDYRKKGLIWYPTYECRFQGRYTLANEEQVSQKVRLHFDFPEPDATYNDFSAMLDDQPIAVSIDPKEGIDYLLELSPGQSKIFYIRYRTRGMDFWRYQPDAHTGRVRNLHLEVFTGFKAVDYVGGSLSPMTAEPTDKGMRLVWQATDLITQADFGVIIPEKLNPGPLTSRITFFAPVCLIFFFVLVTAIGIVQKIPVHPMHYLFIAAGFFAFHLLLAYLVDHIHIHLAFILAATVSVGLVTAYLNAALKQRLAWKTAMAGQIFYLILFSYSFFLKGATGLTVAIGSVATLAVLMKFTAAMDWEKVFAKAKTLPVVPPVKAETARPL